MQGRKSWGGEGGSKCLTGVDDMSNILKAKIFGFSVIEILFGYTKTMCKLCTCKVDMDRRVG